MNAATSPTPTGTDSSERELLFVLPSDIRFVPIAEAAVSQLCRDLKFDEDMVQLIGVSVVEGLMNAIKHGNKYDLEKKVYFYIKVDSKAATLKIRDEGPGFNPAKVANPFEGENLFRDSGRGILMMNAYMDEAYHNEKGNELTLVKYLPT